MVMGRTRTDSNDLAKRHIHATVAHRRLIRAGKEEDRGTLRTYRRMGNPRKTLATALHPQSRQFDSRQLGVEIAFRGDENLDLRGAYRRLVRLGVSELGSAAPRHDSIFHRYAGNRAM